ncbi:MAG: sulfotransferase [Kiritimatiellia bacterium]|nr:sulfotransferase [Kiritimatiellia bacterium]
MKKPNFFIVGFPKCGTSAMYDMLQQHPEVAFSIPGEPRYFCKDLCRESVAAKPDLWHDPRELLQPFFCRTEGEYLRCFAHVRDEKAVGDATVYYLFSKVAAAEIRAYSPGAKIIIMVREPVDLLHSYHSMLVRGGREPIDVFEEALAAEEDRRNAQRTVQRGTAHPSELYYSEQVRFTEQIDRFRRSFPEEQIRIVIYDDFKNDNVGQCKMALQFLEVDADHAPQTKIVNPNQVTRLPALKRLLESELVFERMRRAVPPAVYDRGRRLYKRIMFTKAPRPPLPEALRRRLQVRYREEVERLGQMLDRDLCGLWGYVRESS